MLFRSGRDVLNGGAGVDRMFGGEGNDTFDFNVLAHSTALAFDTIEDFAAGMDTIDLAGIDADRKSVV